VLMCGVVDFVVTFGLEEEVPSLPADHCHQPANQRRGCWILEDKTVRGKKAKRAQQVERLINATVMIVAVVVPPLDSQSFEKTLHAVSFPDLPALEGHEEGNIAIWLQSYDSSELRGSQALASKALPPCDLNSFPNFKVFARLP
jgi:hypothetical protein